MTQAKLAERAKVARSWLARVEAVHRRASHRPAMELRVGTLYLSLANKRLVIDDLAAQL